MRISGVFIFMLSIFALEACVDDTVPTPVYPCDNLSETPNYNNEIKAIVDANCATAGCHVDAFLFGDFSTFQGMEDYLPARINEEVLGEKTMPPAGFPELSQEDLIKISCWLEAGYPEN